MIDTVRGRLTLWYVSALALILILFGIAVYVLLSRALHRRVDHALRSTIEISITSLTHDTQEGQSPQSAAQSTAAELSHPQQAMMIFDDSGRLLATHPGEEDLQIQLPDRATIPEADVSLYTIADAGSKNENYRIAVRRVTIPPTGTPCRERLLQASSIAALTLFYSMKICCDKCSSTLWTMR